MKQPIYVNCIRDAKQPAAISCYQLIDDSRKLRNVASAVSREFANITPITNFLTCLDQLCIITTNKKMQ